MLDISRDICSKSVFVTALVVVSLFISVDAFAQSSIGVVSPSNGDRGDTLDVRIIGSETNFESDVSVAEFSGDGITVNSMNIGDATHAIANVTIDADASIGARDVNVITGGEFPTPATGGFTVAYPSPTFTAITPSDGTNDGVISITDIAGTNFRNGATVKFKKAGENDITCEGVVAVSSEQISCDCDIDGAKAGFWNVYVENDDGQNATLQDGFEVDHGTTPNAAIEILKAGPTEAEVGDRISFTFLVRNTGLLPLFNVLVTDPFFGNSWFRQIGSLASGDYSRFDIDYTITETDSDPMVNTATARARDEFGNIVTDKNDHTIDVLFKTLSIVKSGADILEFGNTMVYQFLITNGGEWRLSNVTVTDPLFGSDWSYDVGTLESNTSSYFEVEYRTIDTDPNRLINTATVTGIDEFGVEFSDEDSHTLNLGSYGGCALVPLAGNMYANHLSEMLYPFIAILIFALARRFVTVRAASY